VNYHENCKEWFSLEFDIRINEVFVNGHLQSYILVESILAGNKKYFKTVQGDVSADTIWRFDDECGIWREDGVPYIEKIIEESLSTKIKARYFYEILKIFKVETYVKHEDFEDDPGSIALQNGEYDLVTDTLIHWNPNHNHKNRLPVRYDPEADCPAFKKFLKEILPEDQNSIQELFGYLLVSGYPIQRAFIFHGAGANGKSTLILVIEAFLGKENVSTITLFDLVTQRFSKAELFGKRANIAPDIGAEELKKTGLFKTLTGRDTITAERKNQHPFQFVNYAKLIFSCNQLPTSPDNSDAFFRRFQIYTFTKVFNEKDPATIDQKTLLQTIANPQELSGILNWALCGYHRLIENGMKLSESRGTETIKELYLEMADPINAFLKTETEEDSEAETLKNEFYRAYRDFCILKGHIALEDNRFFRTLNGRVSFQDSQKTVNGTRVRFLKGIRLLHARDTQDAQVPSFGGVKLDQFSSDKITRASYATRESASSIVQ